MELNRCTRISNGGLLTSLTGSVGLFHVLQLNLKLFCIGNESPCIQVFYLVVVFVFDIVNIKLYLDQFTQAAIKTNPR